MVTAHRTTSDALSELRQRATQFDLYQALRLIDAAHPELPPLGEAAGPYDEAVRIGFDPGLDFAASDIARGVAPADTDQLRLDARGFGLLGPNGPLPLNVTEQIRSALLHHNDAAPLHFIELLQHRLTALFYRAYGQARASIQADRPESDHFALYLGALFGWHPAAANRDAFSDGSRLYFTGRWAAATRSAEALEAVIVHEFHVPVVVTPFALGWLPLERETQSALGRDGEASLLGEATIVGARVQDRQSQLQLNLGPMPLALFETFLPTGDAFAPLAALVVDFTRGELLCRARLILRADDIPPTVLGEQGQLGYVSWLDPVIGREDATDAEFTLC
ncbi:MAG: type VI secretion system baseplate subunit TssG [Planctomycetaceae bacterium]|nr:type VI secretion system baseplate subunit TssG [Planctomycetaceae bacterium]